MHQTVWPNDLRRCVKAAVRKGVVSNPTAVKSSIMTGVLRRSHTIYRGLILIPSELEPGIFGYKDQRLIHWATGPVVNCTPGVDGMARPLLVKFVSHLGKAWDHRLQPSCPGSMRRQSNGYDSRLPSGWSGFDSQTAHFYADYKTTSLFVALVNAKNATYRDRTCGLEVSSLTL